MIIKCPFLVVNYSSRNLIYLFNLYRKWHIEIIQSALKDPVHIQDIINDIVESFIKVYTTFEAKDTVYKNAAENS